MGEEERDRPEETYEVGPAPKRPPPEPTPRIEAGSLLDGFDEDADFEHDPEVEAAGAGTKPGAHAAAPAGAHRRAHPKRWLVQPGWPPTRLSLAVGLVLLGAATLAAGVVAEARGFVSALATFYLCWLHAGTGLLAGVVTATFSERGLNHPERVLVRMLVASSAFHLVMLVELPIPTHLVEFMLAAGVYVVAVVVQFRLPRFETALLLISHFGLWAVVELGDLLRSHAAG